MNSVLDLNNKFSLSRNSTAYTSDGILSLPYNARYESAGRLGNGIMFEEATTNLAGQDKFYINQSNWTGSITITNIDRFRTSASINYGEKIGTVSTWNYISYPSIPKTTWDTSKQYTLSLWLRTSNSGTVWVSIRNGNGLNTVMNQVATYPTYEWARYDYTFTPLVTGDVPVIYISATDNAQFDIADPQIEQKAYATSYTESSRLAEYATIPTAGLFGATEGTIEITFIPNYNQNDVQRTASSRSLIADNNGALAIWYAQNVILGTTYDIRNADNSRVYTEFTDATNYAMLQKGKPTKVAMVWNSTTLRAFQNGVMRTIAHSGSLKAIGSLLYLGASSTGLSQYPNGIITDVRFSNIARPDAELQANGVSTSPLPLDANTTLKLDLNSPDGQRITKQTIL